MQQVDLQSQIDALPIDDLRAQFEKIMGEVVILYGDNKEEEKVQDAQQHIKH